MTTESQQASHQISTFNEKPLHAALKEWYAQPGAEFEVSVDGFIVDIVQGDLLIEIQTRGFSALKQKMAELVARHPVRLVYPVAREKWIVKLAQDRRTRLSRRKSPKRGGFEHVFGELVSFPEMLCEANFSLEVLLIREEELRRRDKKRGWRRRGWVIHERRLLEVVDQRLYKTPVDMVALLPAALVESFTTSDLAAAMNRPRRLAQQMAYCLRKMGAITPVGKQGRATLYVRAQLKQLRSQDDADCIGSHSIPTRS